MDDVKASESALNIGSHEWVVKNYSQHKRVGVKKPIESDEFTVSSLRWAICLYPGGNTVGVYDAGDASLFLYYASSVPVQFLYELYLLDQSGKGNHRGLSFFGKGMGFKSLTYGYMAGKNHFINRRILESPDYLKDDCLKIRCKIGVLTSRIRNLPDIGADFGKLLESKESGDVLFKVGDEKILGHKCMLLASSPVFRSLISDCHQSQEEIVISGNALVYIHGNS